MLTMTNIFKQFFDHMLTSANPKQEIGEHTLQLATAALLFEMTRIDYDIKNTERQAVSSAIRATFQLSLEETDELVRLAEIEAEQTTSYYELTSLINKQFTPAQKIQVIEHMWQVAFADGELDKYEDHLIRKIADLLYVPHSDFIAAKHRVQDSNEAAPPSS
jgi:uncharacterized tellurite resistance protein B-like protein